MPEYCFSSRVRFAPWIGTEYRRGVPPGRHLLIIGESHYSGQERDLAEDRRNRNLTRDVICRQWNGETYSYFTKLSEAVSGKPCREGPVKQVFWNTVAFYNFIQDIVSVGARVAPTEEHRQEALKVLPKIIDRLEPNCVLATGKRLWEGLPESWLPGPKIGFEGQEWDTCEYHPSNANPLRATYIHHPSGFGFGTGSRWSPLVKSFLDLPLLRRRADILCNH